MHILNWTVLHLTSTLLYLGKVFIGNKRDIAEGRIPELNTYMKVMQLEAVWLNPLFAVWLLATTKEAHKSVYWTHLWAHKRWLENFSTSLHIQLSM